MHGLADFHGLLSVSREVGGAQCIVVYARAAGAGAGAADGGAQSDGGGGGRSASGGRAGPSRSGSSVSEASTGLMGSSPGAGATARSIGGGGASGASPARWDACRGLVSAASGPSPARPRPGAKALGPAHLEITCTDILLAMAEVGQTGLNQLALERFVATMHGHDDDGHDHDGSRYRDMGTPPKQRGQQ